MTWCGKLYLYIIYLLYIHNIGIKSFHIHCILKLHQNMFCGFAKEISCRLLSVLCVACHNLFFFIDALHVPNLMLLYHIYFDAKKVRIHQFGIILSGHELMRHDFWMTLHCLRFLSKWRQTKRYWLLAKKSKQIFCIQIY